MNPVEILMIELRESALVGRKLGGVAVPYGVTSEVAPHLRERFEAGSAVGLVPALLNYRHNALRPLAVVEWRQDDDGLHFEATLGEGARQDEALEEFRQGQLRGASVEFSAIRASFVDGVRSISRALVAGLALTPTPAYEAAVVEQRQALWLPAEPPKRRRRMHLWP